MAKGNQEYQELAFYYPGHLWRHTDWIKSLLLFFDGVGLLIPEYKKGEPERIDPFLAEPLREQGLLHYLVADEVVDQAATAQLATALMTFITSGAFDDLSRDGTAFHEISMSRMGYYGDGELAETLFEELKSRGLAKESEDGVSIPLHPSIRYLILVLLAQILRPQGLSKGFALSPATDQTHIVRGLTEFLNLPTAPSAGHVIAFDLQSVGVDLSSIPLDEALDFRKQNLAAHKAYAKSVREFASQLSAIPEPDRYAAFADRQAELDQVASDLKRRARTAWRRPASFALGFAGAAWSADSGDVLGVLLGAGSLALGMGADPISANAYSYVFAAHARYA